MKHEIVNGIDGLRCKNCAKLVAYCNSDDCPCKHKQLRLQVKKQILENITTRPNMLRLGDYRKCDECDTIVLVSRTDDDKIRIE